MSKKILQAIIKLLNHNFFFSLSFCPYVLSIDENAIFRILKDFVFMAFFVFLGFETEIKVFTSELASLFVKLSRRRSAQNGSKAVISWLQDQQQWEILLDSITWLLWKNMKLDPIFPGLQLRDAFLICYGNLEVVMSPIPLH